MTVFKERHLNSILGATKMVNLPLIIFTEPPSRNYPHIFVYAQDFFDLIQNLNMNYIYSAYAPHNKNTDLALYFTNGGFIIAMSTRDRSFLNEIIPKDFDEFYTYLEAIYHRIKSMEEFNNYKQSEYYTVTRDGYEEYLIAKDLGFSSKKEYREAKSHGITDYNYYREYKASDMGYNDFVRAKEGGFTSKQEYTEAKKLGIVSLKELGEYKKHRFDPYLEKIEEIRKDALEAFKIQRYEEFLRLEYLLAEKLVETLYFKAYEKELDQNQEEKIVEILLSIGKKLNRQFNVAELDNWRRERNLVVHEHKKIDQTSALKVKQFFDSFYNEILKDFS